MLYWTNNDRHYNEKSPLDPQIYKQDAGWKSYWATNMSHFLNKSEVNSESKLKCGRMEPTSVGRHCSGAGSSNKGYIYAVGFKIPMSSLFLSSHHFPVIWMKANYRFSEPAHYCMVGEWSAENLSLFQRFSAQKWQHIKSWEITPEEPHPHWNWFKLGNSRIQADTVVGWYLWGSSKVMGVFGKWKEINCYGLRVDCIKNCHSQYANDTPSGGGT